MRPSVRRPSICPSRYLLLNQWAEFNQTCYITPPTHTSPLMVRVCESNIIFPCVRRLSICPSRYFLVNRWRNSAKLAISLLLMVRVCESNIILLCVRPCTRPPSICPSRYLLNRWVEFNQTCFITSAHCKGVWEHYNFSCVRRRPCFRRPSICP